MGIANPALADRVWETTATTGTGTVTLAGAVSGYRTFTSACVDQQLVYYVLSSGSNWEVGLGTFTTSGTTLARTTILSSSNSGSAITLAGTSQVFNSEPATYLIRPPLRRVYMQARSIILQ